MILLQPLVIFVLALLDILLNLVELTLAHIRHLARSLHLLRETLHSDRPGCICQKFQLVQVFLRLSLVLLLGNQSHQHRRLGLDL